MRKILTRLEQGVEPNNTKVHSLPRSTVRQSLAYAALQLARNHKLEGGIRASLDELSSDSDRYVAGFLKRLRAWVNAHSRVGYQVQASADERLHQVAEES